MRVGGAASLFVLKAAAGEMRAGHKYLKRIKNPRAGLKGQKKWLYFYTTGELRDFRREEAKKLLSRIASFFGVNVGRPALNKARTEYDRLKIETVFKGQVSQEEFSRHWIEYWRRPEYYNQKYSGVRDRKERERPETSAPKDFTRSVRRESSKSRKADYNPDVMRFLVTQYGSGKRAKASGAKDAEGAEPPKQNQQAAQRTESVRGRQLRPRTPESVETAIAAVKKSKASNTEKVRSLLKIEEETPQVLTIQPDAKLKERQEISDKDISRITDLNVSAADSGGKPIELDLIHASSKGQVRKNFDTEKLKKLKESIAENGLIQAPVVRPSKEKPGHYEIIAGERRIRALRLLQKEGRLDGSLINVIVQDVDNRTAGIIQLEENFNREDNTAGEIADHLKKMIDEENMSIPELARRSGRSQATVRNYLAITNLHPDLRKLLDRGEMSSTAAQILGTLPEHGRQLRAHSLMLQKNLRTQTLRQLVSDMKTQGEFFTLEDVQTDAMKRARKELEGHDPSRLVGKFNTFMDRHQQALNRFIEQDSSRLSSLALSATGDYENTMKRMELMQDQIDSIIKKMREHRDKISGEPALFKSWMSELIELSSLCQKARDRYICDFFHFVGCVAR